MSRESQREQVRAWFKQHPNYYREWTAKDRTAKTLERAEEFARKVNKPPVVKGRITYKINVTNPLTEEERVQPQL